MMAAVKGLLYCNAALFLSWYLAMKSPPTWNVENFECQAAERNVIRRLDGTVKHLHLPLPPNFQPDLDQARPNPCPHRQSSRIVFGYLEEKDPAGPGRDFLEMVALEGNLSLRISPPPFSCVHLHRKYSIYRLEKNDAQKARAGDPWSLLAC